jgi:hypothetical protein
VFDEKDGVGTFAAVTNTLGKSSELVGKGTSPFLFGLCLLDEVLIFE